MSDLKDFKDTLKAGLRQKCPRCQEGDLFSTRLSLDVRDKCPECNLDLSKSDTADGPAVFLIFILGFAIVPIALWIAMNVTWPLWIHAILWTGLCLIITLGSLRPLKSYIIYLQYKHRPEDWKD